MRSSFILLILLSGFIINNAGAQALIDTTSSPAAPIGGIERLALRYYDIEFTPEQRKLIEGVQLEMIFFISDEGSPRLESVNGISNYSILDSLYARDTFLPKFKPELRQGIPKQSLYFMRFEFPTYRIQNADLYRVSIDEYKRPTKEDFAEIELSQSRLDIVFGGMVNSFIGDPATYLSLGGGMKVELAYTFKNHIFYGMNMNFYGNRRTAEYDVNSSLPQFSHPNTLLIGVSAGRWFGRYAAQLDMNYVVQNITERLPDDDSEWIQFRGFCPGILVSRPIQLGKDRLDVDGYYGRPAIIAHHINLNLGLRYLWMSHRPASGMMVELGLSYRLGVKMINSYRLKDSYYK